MSKGKLPKWKRESEKPIGGNPVGFWGNGPMPLIIPGTSSAISRAKKRKGK